MPMDLLADPMGYLGAKRAAPATPKTLFAIIGDSNVVGAGADPGRAAPENQISVSNSNVVFNKFYSQASAEPLTMSEVTTGDLRATSLVTSPAFGPELSFGQTIFELLNGFGATATPENKPWVASTCITGITLDQWRPDSPFGEASPVFGGVNLYTAWENRMLQFQIDSGRQLGGVLVNIGTNDASDATISGNFAANMIAFATRVRATFGAHVKIVWFKTHVDTSRANVVLVRSQQVSAAASISELKLVVIDQIPLIADLLHYDSDGEWWIGGVGAYAMGDLLGYSRRAVSALTLVGYGTPAYADSGSGTAIKPRGYPGTQDGDMEILVVFTATVGTAAAPPTPAGWTAVPGAAGTSSASGFGQGFAMFSRLLAQADLDGGDGNPPAVPITPGGSVNVAQRFTVRGATKNPVIDGTATAFAAGAFSGSSAAAAGVTTSAADALVFCAWGSFDSGGAGQFPPFTASNAALASFGVAKDAMYSTNSSGFYSLSAYRGVKAAAGASGTTTVTPVAGLNTNPTGATMALRAA